MRKFNLNGFQKIIEIDVCISKFYLVVNTILIFTFKGLINQPYLMLS